MQAKDIALLEALEAVNWVSGFYKSQRTDESFDRSYKDAVKTAEELGIGSPRYSLQE